MKLSEIVENKIDYLKDGKNDSLIINGEIIYNNGDCQILSQSSQVFEFYVFSEFENKEVKIIIDDHQIYPVDNKEIVDWDKYSYASLLQLDEELKKLDPKKELLHKKYTREGMIKRVLAERKQKAENRKRRTVNSCDCLRISPSAFRFSTVSFRFRPSGRNR
ncbi:MAG: hypothetical protein L3J74_16460 [Bacteroidales bacterium]|nr:hypothetical protein [Bacteroidales bacterium]